MSQYRTPFLLSCILAMVLLQASPAAQAACSPGARWAVEVEITGCTTKTPRTSLLETRILQSVELAPFLQNCPAPQLSATTGQTQSFLYSASARTSLRDCTTFKEGSRHWMLANKFCCDVEPPSEACEKGWQRLEELGPLLSDYLIERGILEGERDPALCRPGSDAFALRIEQCTPHDPRGVLIDAEIVSSVAFDAWPGNCPMPEAKDVRAGCQRSARFLHPEARDCRGYSPGRELWVYSRGQCCDAEAPAQSQACRLGVRQIVETERNFTIEQFLVERGYKEPASH